MHVKRVDYVFFTSGEGTRDQIVLSEKRIADMQALHITCRMKKRRKDQKRWILPKQQKKKMLTGLRHVLRHYDLSDSVIGADRRMAHDLQLEELLLQARKLELLQNRERILRQVGTGEQTVSKAHRHMLLVLDSEKWNRKELYTILLTAKDLYEEISLLCEKDSNSIRSLATELYEECGLVLHIRTGGEEGIRADFVLFLLRDWQLEQWNMVEFGTAYTVVDVEAGPEIRRCRERLMEHGIKREGRHRIYAGLVYEQKGKQLPYQFGANLAWQKPSLYEEFEISIVAIYRMEW
ncbi:MAG: hypothetical protein IJ801_03805 [Lachnospiraceae bacterium]|nr:hypothetical protein [Lachnospiraceae bacterium]